MKQLVARAERCTRAIWIGAALLLAVSAKADEVVTVDPAVRYQVFEGWGTSLAWWARVVGDFPEPIRSEYLDRAFDPVKGLGLSVVRYNIGGGESPDYLAPNRQFLQYRAAIPGYEPVQGTWDWSADAAQRGVLEAAIARGADKLEAFSNSPPYWMTKSGSVTGNKGGGENLKPEAYDLFADYLVTVARHFHDSWGVTFRWLEPLNEPSGSWGFGNGQEGCHVDPANQNLVVKAVGAALAKSGLDTRVTASDEPYVAAADSTFPHYDAVALSALGKINTHSYWGGDRTQLAERAKSAGKALWLSEYGDGDPTGMEMSRRILEDMRSLRPSAWVYWQVVDSVGGWGFLKNPLRDETTTAYTVNRKYWVMANYSRFIRPGYRLIAIDDPNSLAALDERSGTLVIVTTNSKETSVPITYDLSRFSRLGASAAGYRTSSTEELAPLPGAPITGRRLSVEAPAGSVTTYVVTGADYSGRRDFDVGRYYRIVNAQTGEALQKQGGSASDFTAVELAKPDPQVAAQDWTILPQGAGLVKLVNRSDGLLLEVGQSATASGASVDLYHDKVEPGRKSNQLWRVVRAAKGTFVLENTNSGLVLDAGAGAAAPIRQMARGSSAGQLWRLTGEPGNQKEKK